MSFSEFLQMGGYGVYVWPALLISVAVLMGLTGLSIMAYRREKALLERLEQAGHDADH